MATCGICSRETCDVPISRDLNIKYSQGDFYSLKESVYTPIYDILRRTFADMGSGSDAFERSQHSFNNITSTVDVIKDGRPAVIMKDDDDDDNKGLMVCLATTYSGEDISKLPHIFRHFSIPIALYDRTSPGHFDHLHSLPEWGRENAYIIAWQFRSTATRKGLWTAKTDGEEVPQVLGRDAMRFLITECDRRWEAWKEMCKDPELAAKLEAELRIHIAERKKCFYDSAGSRASSRESVATVDGPSWRSRVRSPMTIPEEPENNVVSGLGAPKKLGSPRPHKFTGKPRTGSTYSFTSASGKRADADKNSIKSIQSRTSLAQKSGGGFLNKFEVLRTLKVNAG